MSLSPLNGNTPAGISPARAPLADTPITIRQPQAAPLKPDLYAAKDARASDAEVENAVATLNDFTAMVAQDVRFSVDAESGRTLVKVIDTSTQEVLRQFPSAEALSIARAIDKVQGLLIREKA